MNKNVLILSNFANALPQGITPAPVPGEMMPCFGILEGYFAPLQNSNVHNTVLSTDHLPEESLHTGKMANKMPDAF